MTILLPFKVEAQNPFRPKQQQHIDIEAWANSIKKKARENLANDFERLRIEWVSRYKIPKHQHYEEYTPEEMLLETWEQFLFENPDSLEAKGVYKKVDRKTGAKYYETGDPLIDKLERAFAAGEDVDLQEVFKDVKNGKDIFKAKVFQGMDGAYHSARSSHHVVQENAQGDKIDVAGVKIEHDNYDSDEFLMDALKDDPILKGWAGKLR